MADICKWSNISFNEAKKTLRQWREEHVRRSEEVIEIWEEVLAPYCRSLGDELWLCYEQVFVAALDCARFDIADLCLNALRKKFPQSNRVLKSQAMRYEALERYDEALAIYEQLIELDPTNMSYRKRKVAILIAQNERQEAIREMNEYLKIFLNDNEAWLELSNLYLQDQDYPRAAHCAEELILSNPHNSLYLRRIAEIRYTQGGQENIELAKLLFEQAIRTNPTCIRSHFGLLLCCNWLSQKATGSRKKELAQLGASTIDKLVEKYKANQEEKNSENAIDEIKLISSLKAQLSI